MRLVEPWWLLLLLALPVAAWLKGRLGGQPSFLYSSIQLVQGITGLTRSRSGAVLMALRWLALAAFIVGMTRPQWGQSEEKIKASGIDIAVAFDLSGSMMAEDFQWQGERVNRMTIAREVLKGFIAERPSDRIGLIAFAGRAYIASPLTLDHDFLRENLERLKLGDIEDGTAIGSAITAGLNRLRDLDSKSRIIILMTDGVNNSGEVPPLTAAEAAETLKVKIYAIGVGTRGQAPVPYIDVFGRKRRQMQPVDIDEETLQKISERTGGKYYRADNSAKLRKIYGEIDVLEKTEVEVKRFHHYDELFPWFVLGGLAFLLLEMILANTAWRRLP